jgi:transcription elongation factor Elf1
VPVEPGKVHVHHRHEPNGHKDQDRSYDIVRVSYGDATETIEGMAARAFAVSELSGKSVEPLACPHCGDTHIDELMFATQPHVKHLCNSCGRNFRHHTPSISNPLGGAQGRLGLPAAAEPRHVDRPLDISSTDYGGVAIWPSNSAIVSTMSRPEDAGVHVHAWSAEGELVIDDTYSPLILDGAVIEESLLRALAVQRALSESDQAPIVSLACVECGHSITSPTTGWIQPSTRHTCDSCGAVNRTRRRSFVNPLAAKPAKPA